MSVRIGKISNISAPRHFNGLFQNSRAGIFNDAHEMIGAAAGRTGAGFSYVGFVEGGDILSTRCDVIVTDGFTGNIALKMAEGTSHMLAHFLKEALTSPVLARSRPAGSMC